MSLLPFLRLAGELKRVPRTGWLHSGVPSPVVESVADHSWRVGVLALAVAGGAGTSSLRDTNLRKKKKKRRKC
jgi:putative hydrolase of HD superfamily